jgi:hypothetical protein
MRLAMGWYAFSISTLRAFLVPGFRPDPGGFGLPLGAPGPRGSLTTSEGSFPGSRLATGLANISIPRNVSTQQLENNIYFYRKSSDD